MRRIYMSIEKISNEEFREILFRIFTEELESEINEDYLLNTISNEFKKAKHLRDYPLIHECFLTLSECYDYSYNNKFEELSEKQIKRRRAIREFKQFFVKSKTAVF